MSTLCELFGKSRQAYYQRKKYVYKEEVKTEILLQMVAKERIGMPNLGGRKLLVRLESKLPEELRLGRDSFFNFLRSNQLLVRRKRGIRTTYSDHWMHKYPNLIKDIIPSRPHQIWVSDITYIPTTQGFAYLSLITDLYSRKIIGWKIGSTLQAKHTLEALETAIKQLPKGSTGIIHHSDRGAQYCCDDYVKMLKSNNISISMTENGDPRENAVAERVNGILKSEWLNQMKLKTRQEALTELLRIIRIYNQERPHGSISMKTPEYAHSSSDELSRCWKNYYKRKPAIKKYNEILTL
ncbi:MAG TPA: IS3 family transposase [Chitinispirillaceae bacterium]|nr:IS3 family transposase [Chitinispirillaceae bacterium]